MRKIVAIGGGENGRILEDGTYADYETEIMDREIIRLTGKEKPNFLFLAHSQSSSLESTAGQASACRGESAHRGRKPCDSRGDRCVT